MIIKKPYLFFLKHFKLINILLSFIIGYLIYIDDKLLRFLNKYVYVNDTKVHILDSINTNYLIIIPIIICIMSIILLSIMFKKNKPVKFYFINIFLFIAIIVINSFIIGFMDKISREIVPIKYIKFARDLKLISIIIETISAVYLFMRGVGLNIKKFDFSSDVSNITISDDDNEEVELFLDVDNIRLKKQRKIRLNKLKIKYLENKFKINSIFIIVTLLISLVSFYEFYLKKYINLKEENTFYEYKDLSIKVNSSYYSRKDFLENVISDKYLIVVNISIKEENKILLNEFNLKINNVIFKPIENYYDYYVDLGNRYEENISKNYKDYILIFEVPKKYIKKNAIFSIYNINIKLKLKNLDVLKSDEKVLSIGESATIDDSYFNIKNYDIRDEFIIEYPYCYNGGCVDSIEHLRGTISENFDKCLLKLNIDSNINFYTFFNNFGSILYRINGVEYVQESDFEQVKSKYLNYNDIYIGINKDIINADFIKLIFKKRNIKIEYILRGDS